MANFISNIHGRQNLAYKVMKLLNNEEKKIIVDVSRELTRDISTLIYILYVYIDAIIKEWKTRNILRIQDQEVDFLEE